MPERHPKPISAVQRRARLQRVTQIARGFGFIGLLEYRHVTTDSGGAQYGIGPVAAQDVLTVYAKAFERDRDPADFSLEAIIAHERGHQLLLRHPSLALLQEKWGRLDSEEILASLVGSVIVSSATDRENLFGKALVEAINRGLTVDQAGRLLNELRYFLERIL